MSQNMVSMVKASSALSNFRRIREFTESLCRPLEVEDFVIQSMPDASPIRWHLAHTTWFFETFVLKPFAPDYGVYSPGFEVLFNSYYNSVGEQFTRAKRGLLSRPTVAEIMAYRQAVDESIFQLLESNHFDSPDDVYRLVELGLHHEQQHQELILTDLKHALAQNPLYPAYVASFHDSNESEPAVDLAWQGFEGGIYEIGHLGEGFAYDNESPRHETLLRPFEIGSRLVTSGEYLRFMEDGGYARPELWLSLGWNSVQSANWQSPLYWTQLDGQWHEFTLGGLRPIDLLAPVTHVSYFEADAYARWSGVRLPLESEWEHASLAASLNGNFVESAALHPLPAQATPTNSAQPISQMLGDCWEWTASAYLPYPGYRPAPGAVGEYNGKFMCNQYVLRGGSCATSSSHIRRTYRNFFPPDARWQFTGVRLAKDAET